MKYQSMPEIKIDKLDIAEAYFKGKAELNGKEHTINIQGHWVDKLIKLPFLIPTEDKVLIRLSGPGDAYVEDTVYFKGMSEGIEIDSQDVLHYVADHQDEFDTLEVYFSSSE
jgi:hypothetical protein